MTNDEIIQEFREFATSQAENIQYYLRTGAWDSNKVSAWKPYYDRYSRHGILQSHLNDEWDRVLSNSRTEAEDLHLIDKSLVDKYVWLNTRQANVWSLLLHGETYLAYDQENDCMLFQIDQSEFADKWTENFANTKTRIVSDLFVYMDRIISEIPTAEQE